MKNSKGFSLLEMLVVVGLVGILTAVAVPNLIAARKNANETSALATVKTIHSAETTYFTVNDGYASIPTLLAENYISQDAIGSAIPAPCPLPGKGMAPGFGTLLYMKSGYVVGNAPTDTAFIGVLRIKGIYIAAIPASVYFGGTIRSGQRIFYIDSYSNIPFVLNASLTGAPVNPCAAGIYCMDTSPRPIFKYARCSPIQN